MKTENGEKWCQVTDYHHSAIELAKVDVVTITQTCDLAQRLAKSS